METKKVYCIFQEEDIYQELDTPYYKLIKIFDSLDKAKNFINKIHKYLEMEDELGQGENFKIIEKIKSKKIIEYEIIGYDINEKIEWIIKKFKIESYNLNK